MNFEVIRDYEKYRGWFVGELHSIPHERGLSILLHKGIREWLETSHTVPDRPIPGITLQETCGPSANDLVMLLASMIGG